MASLVLNHGSYYAVFSITGRKKWVKIGSVDRANARKILKQLEVEFAKDRLNLTQPKRITFYEFANEYLQYASVNKAGNTLIIETKVCKQLKEDWGNILLVRINKQMIELYKANRVKTGIQPATVSNSEQVFGSN